MTFVGGMLLREKLSAQESLIVMRQSSVGTPLAGLSLTL
jgi:hypothetical protein